MKIRYWLPLLAALLFAGAGCSGGDSNDPDAGVVVPDSGPGDAGEEETPDGGPVSEECEKPANLAKKQQLASAQPVLGVKSKQVITRAATWPSEAGDSSVTCSIELQFKDSNGNGQLDPYEDWTLGAPQRAADLLGRMSADEKMALMAHATLTDVPSGNGVPSAAVQALVGNGVRFGRTAANSAALNARAAWANSIQEQCEASALGIPFVLSADPMHSTGPGRTKAKGFSHWPNELSLAASGDVAAIEQFGKFAAQEYRAIGVRMALSPSADLFTEPRRFMGQYTFGEDSAAVGERVAAYIKGFQGATLGRESVACVVNHFPGAGPAKAGWDARLEKGKYVTYPGNNIGAHVAPFEKAFDAGVAGVMPGYGILEQGAWTGLGGLLDGSTIEQVGAAYNKTLLTDVLRQHYQYSGLVLAPWGVLENKGVSPLGAPWGVESQSKAERVAKAVVAGVDQFGGLDDTAAIAAAKGTGLISDAQIDAAAGRALALVFGLGLFENPYVDAAKAPQLCNTDDAYQAGLRALNAGMVLLVNADKPGGWLNGDGDGSQVGDKGNAGNGTKKVLPAPPGAPYVAAGCSYFVLGNFDLDYVRSVSAGYGDLTNDATSIHGVKVETPAERIGHSDYVFIRVGVPSKLDPDSGVLKLPTESLEYGPTDEALLADVAAARAAIDATPGSKTQIVVSVDAGRPSVVSELMNYGISGLYINWNASATDSAIIDDKVFLDVAFGITNGKGKLQVGLPLSDAAVQDPSQQKEDLPGDGQHSTFVRGFGLETPMF